MGGESDDRFDSSASGIVYQGRQHNRADPGFKEGVAESPGSGMRMLTYFINRAGRGLTAMRRAKLEKAKSLLAKEIERQKTS